MERSSALLKSHQSWYTNYLVAEKDRMDAERAKRKEKYDSSCSDLESARQKQDRDPDKGDKAFNRAKAEMECAKDAYLASIQACNRSSATFFARDLPQMHRQYQTLWTLIVSSLSNFLRQGCGMTDTHLEKLKEINGRALDAVNKIEPATDQAIYVEMNARAFFPPPDKAFEPCALWHDDPKVVLSETGKSFLQNMAATSQKRRS